MHSIHAKTRTAHPSVKRPRYRVVNHREAGLFDSMTAATIWAIKNLKDWDWKIEPVAGRRSSEKSPPMKAPINLGIEDEVLQNMPSEC